MKTPTVYRDGNGSTYVLERQPAELPLYRDGVFICLISALDYWPRLFDGRLKACGTRRRLMAVHEEGSLLRFPSAEKTVRRERVEGGVVFVHRRTAHSWTEAA